MIAFQVHNTSPHHTYTGNMAEQQMPFLKVSVLHYRDQSRDEGEWMKWYLEEQIPRFVPVAHKHGIDRLELVSFFQPISSPSLHTASLATTNVLGERTVLHPFGLQGTIPV